MRTETAGFLPLMLTALSLAVLVLFGCASEKPGALDVKRDHEAISRILDAAVLSNEPARAFEKALVVVRSYSSVDSAWTDGFTFYVNYKSGGTVSWTAPPDPTTQGKQ